MGDANIIPEVINHHKQLLNSLRMKLETFLKGTDLLVNSSILTNNSNNNGYNTSRLDYSRNSDLGLSSKTIERVDIL